jgi:hypothetical protein
MKYPVLISEEQGRCEFSRLGKPDYIIAFWPNDV